MTDKSVFAAAFFESIPLFHVPEYQDENFRIEGENTEGIVLLSCSSASVLTVDEWAMLVKMLNALKLSFENVALCAAAQPPSFQVLKRRITFSKLLVFGREPQSIGLNINAELYRVIKCRDTTVIFSEPLSLLITNEKAKSMLWKALKEMFELK